MPRVIVDLFRDEQDALIALAERQRRDIRSQAAILIRERLQEMGLVTGPSRIRRPHFILTPEFFAQAKEREEKRAADKAAEAARKAEAARNAEAARKAEEEKAGDNEPVSQ